MKAISSCLVVLLALPWTSARAAIQNYSMKNRIPVIHERGRTYETRYDTYGFRVEILGDDEGQKAESFKRGRPFVTALPGERYSVRLYNPLPVRVAVNLTVDGINSISGKPSGISDGEKWLMEPYSFITIRGWQVSGEEARRFFFTDKPKSYAKWRGDPLDKDLSVNCGVIGAAYFWNQQELNRYWERHPIYRYAPSPVFSSPMLKSEGIRPLAARAAAVADLQAAGTGMGERESNPTTLVDFHYDTGMDKLSQAVVIYYDFAKPEPVPNPFPALSYAPEMP